MEFHLHDHPSKEYSGLISFRMDCLELFDIPVVQDSQESSPTPQVKSINSLVLSFLYGPTLISILDYWKNHSFDNMDLGRQNNVSALVGRFFTTSTSWQGWLLLRAVREDLFDASFR